MGEPKMLRIMGPLVEEKLRNENRFGNRRWGEDLNKKLES